jgi:hydroxyacylglutathione hydrolase
MDAVVALRRQGTPTIPTTVALENATNPFLRADQPALQAAVALPDGDPAEVFGRLRKQKDHA